MFLLEIARMCIVPSLFLFGFVWFSWARSSHGFLTVFVLFPCGVRSDVFCYACVLFLNGFFPHPLVGVLFFP